MTRPRPTSDFFVYQLNITGLAGATVSTIQSLVFDASSDFRWLYSAYSADIASAAVTESTRVNPLVDVLIVPTDTSSQFMNIPVPIVSIFGNGEFPFILPVPRIIAARSAMSFQFTNRTAATTYNIQLSLIGLKQYLG